MLLTPSGSSNNVLKTIKLHYLRRIPTYLNTLYNIIEENDHRVGIGNLKTLN